MKLRRIFVQAAFLPVLLISNRDAQAQCLQNHYVSNGLPSSQSDCQPFASFRQLTPEAMTSAAQDLVASRHGDLVRAAQFYGFNLNAGGWTYTQSVSPILQKHLLLSFTHADPPLQASHFVAVIPAQTGESVQVVPAFAHGLRLFEPGWQKKGTYSVFNRLLESERGDEPIRDNMDWVDIASLYLALTGTVPAVPTNSDSVQATWELTRKRATTPVIIEKGGGGATLAFSDISESQRTISWKLFFDRHGRIEKAEMRALSPEKVQPIALHKDASAAALPAHSALNP